RGDPPPAAAPGERIRSGIRRERRDRGWGRALPGALDHLSDLDDSADLGRLGELDYPATSTRERDAATVGRRRRISRRTPRVNVRWASQTAMPTASESTVPSHGA